MSRPPLRPTAAFLLLAAVGAASAAAEPGMSWGKAGVSFEAYRADAVSCGREAAATDLSGSAPARALVLASRQIETGQSNDYTPMINGAGGLAPMTGRPSFDPSSETALRVARARAAVQVERRIGEARDILAARLEQCLAERGYRRFHLTREQMHRLARLPVGAPERQAYLHGLASDPRILAAQGE